ncbi:hypothetical protein [Bradyrhizobium sp.]|uniref:hypothetical protein n=1 Tax=Bradyrhizobium sp. TaxID=376 RepID=UPI003BAFD9CB
MQQGIDEGWRRADHDARVERAVTTMMQHEHAEFGLTDAQGALQHRPEHRLQIAGRTADDLKDF